MPEEVLEKKNEFPSDSPESKGFFSTWKDAFLDKFSWLLNSWEWNLDLDEVIWEEEIIDSEESLEMSRKLSLVEEICKSWLLLFK